MPVYQEYPPNSELRINNAFISGNGLTVHGDNNSMKVTDATIHGDNNKVHGENAAVHGDNNTIHGTKATIHGNNNKVHGENATVHGNRNKIHGTNAKVTGDHNMINGSNAEIHGCFNINGYNGRGPGHYSQSENGEFVDGNGNPPSPHMRVMLNRMNGQGIPGLGSSDRRRQFLPHLTSVRTDTYTMNANGEYVNSQGIPLPQSDEEMLRDAPTTGPEEYYQTDDGQFVGVQGGVMDPVAAAFLNTHFPNGPHGPTSSTPITTTPIRLHLRGEDEPTDVREESCAICWVQKKVVMSTCCAALATCVQCARATYENKCVGSKQCMLCGQNVTEVFRVS